MWAENRNGKVRYCEEYKDHMTDKRKKVSVTFDKDTAANRRLALEQLTLKIQQLECGDNECGVSLREVSDRYLEYQKLTVKPSTYSRNKFACNAICKILGPDTLIDRLSAQYITKSMIGSWKSAGTLNEHLIRFRALMNWAYSNDYLDNVSFLKKIKRFPDATRKEKAKDKYLEPNEVTTLLEAMENSPHWKMLTEFLILSGLRSGEAIALENEDVMFKNQNISVTKTFDANNKVTTTPKTATSIRDVYMQPELYTLCKKIKILSNHKKLELGVKNAFFLTDHKAEQINYFCYAKYLRGLSKRVLGRIITPHTLRHTHASLLLASGVDIETISRRLGHENSRITRDIYLHVTKKLIETDNEQIKSVNIL